MMKKFMVLTILLASFVLVGCGAKNAATTDTGTTSANNAATSGSDTTVNGAEDAPAVAVDTAKTTTLAECLTEKKVVMYGTEWCGHCKNQKAMFGEGFAKVTYIDCDANRQQCLDAGVRGFPTWIDTQGNQYPGVQQLEKLAEIAGCTM